MRGIDVGELAVLVDLKEGKVASPIWTKVGGDSNGWTNVKINMRFVMKEKKLTGIEIFHI